MYYLKAEASFDAAHFLANYNGKCRNIHGHHWLVSVRICGESLRTDAQECGMLVDFATLKDALKSIVAPLDHTLIYQTGTLRSKTLAALTEEDFSLFEVSFRPTAENFAQYFYFCMQELGYQVAEATVYETPNNCASYSGEV